MYEHGDDTMWQYCGCSIGSWKHVQGSFEVATNTRSLCADILMDILIAYYNAILVQQHSPCYVEEENNAELRHNCAKPGWLTRVISDINHYWTYSRSNSGNIMLAVDWLLLSCKLWKPIMQRMSINVHRWCVFSLWHKVEWTTNLTAAWMMTHKQNCTKWG